MLHLFDLLNFPFRLFSSSDSSFAGHLVDDFHFISFPALLLLKKKEPLWVAPTSDKCLESAFVEGWLA